MSIVVDLPAPFGPRNATVSRWAIETSTPRTAGMTVSPERYDLARPRSSIPSARPAASVRPLPTSMRAGTAISPLSTKRVSGPGRHPFKRPVAPSLRLCCRRYLTPAEPPATVCGAMRRIALVLVLLVLPGCGSTPAPPGAGSPFERLWADQALALLDGLDEALPRTQQRRRRPAHTARPLATVRGAPRLHVHRQLRRAARAPGPALPPGAGCQHTASRPNATTARRAAIGRFAGA